jgi:hypothetical protein
MATTVLRPAPATAIDFDAASDELAAYGAPRAEVEEAIREARARLPELPPDERERLAGYIERQARILASTAPRVAFFGDSTSLMTGLGVTNWAVDHLDQLAPAASGPDMGCGLLADARRREDGEITEPPSECANRLDRWEAQVEAAAIDVAVVQFGPWDVHDLQIETGGPFLTIGEDAELDAALRDELDREVSMLLRPHPERRRPSSPPAGRSAPAPTRWRPSARRRRRLARRRQHRGRPEAPSAGVRPALGVRLLDTPTWTRTRRSVSHRGVRLVSPTLAVRTTPP